MEAPLFWSHTEEFTQNAMDFEKDMQSCKQSADDLKNVWNDRSGLKAQKQCTSIWFWALQGLLYGVLWGD
ncbi:hypothetical protein L1987_30767 [Smallanthus sonchifolius]|uniref:Uncharacterized protein n=1 Tax=Smallanthus sonchifolius TaxID=185202 RepID=A0ACB9I3I2_9ASTR|nr:hypothetical protein L1987_30767 [Smallanthus sonchifolius]